MNETLDELKRKLFGSSSEKTKASQPVEETVPEAEPTTIVKEHKRVRKKKSVRADLYEALPVVEVPCDIPEEWMKRRIGINYFIREQRDSMINAITEEDIEETGVVVENPVIGHIPSRQEIVNELEEPLMTM